MCAIIDANVVHETVGNGATPAGRAFLKAMKPSRRMVVGGKLYDELKTNRAFREWLAAASRAGRVLQVNAAAVDEAAARLSGQCESNDEHVIALAQVSGARLLFTKDEALMRDFRNPALCRPRGTVYTTATTQDFTPAMKKLLNRSRCRAQG